MSIRQFFRKLFFKSYVHDEGDDQLSGLLGKRKNKTSPMATGTRECSSEKGSEEIKVMETPSTPRRGKLYVVYGTSYIFLFALYRFSHAFVLGFSTTIMFPKDVLYFVGDEYKTAVLGVILGLSSLLTLLFSPVFGYLTDRSQLIKWKGVEIGRRKPFVFIGEAMAVVSLLLRSFVRRNEPVGMAWVFFTIYIALGLFGTVGITLSMTAYTGLFPDLFRKKQYDLVSAFMGFCNLLGAAGGVVGVGFLWSIFSYEVNVVIVCIVVVLFTVQLVVFSEEDSLYMVTMSKQKKESKVDSFNILEILKVFVKPFRSYNFSIVFASRFIFMFSIAVVQTFLLYFLRDAIPDYSIFIWSDVIQHEEQALAVVSGVVLSLGLVSSFFGPYLSTKIKRKYVVFLSGILMMMGSLGYLFSRNFSVILLFSAFYGFGLGAYYAVDFSLLSAVLPSAEEAGKDLGIFEIATVLPFSLASPIMGIIIKIGNYLNEEKRINIPNFGYVLLFLFAILVQFVGSVIVLFVRDRAKKNMTLLSDSVFDDIESEDKGKVFLKRTNTNEDDSLKNLESSEDVMS